MPRSIGDPDYVYRPWTEERRVRASAEAKARMARPITYSDLMRLQRRLSRIEKLLAELRGAIVERHKDVKK